MYCEDYRRFHKSHPGETVIILEESDLNPGRDLDANKIIWKARKERAAFTSSKGQEVFGIVFYNHPEIIQLFTEDELKRFVKTVQDLGYSLD